MTTIAQNKLATPRDTLPGSRPVVRTLAAASSAWAEFRRLPASAFPLEHKDRLAIALLIALSGLCAFYGLLALRIYDDNRLTSWLWVFADGRGLALGPVLVLGALAAWPLSGLRLTQHRAPILLCLAAFAVAIPLWSEPEVIVDAARYFAQAKYLEVHGAAAFLRDWGHGVPAWTDLPLLPFVYGLIFQVFGESRLAIQCFTTLCFAGTVLLTWLIGRSLWDERVGLYGGALLLGMPYLLAQVPLMLVDVPTMFLLTLAVYATLKAAGPDRRWLLLAAPAIALAMLAKYSAWLMLSVLPVIFLVQRRPGWGLRAAALAGAVALLLAPALLWKADVVARQIGFLADYQLPGLGRWHETHASTFLFQIHPFVTLAAAASVLLAVARRDARYLIVAWMLALVLLLDVQRSRYALVAFPMLALMAAYAIRWIGDARLGTYLVLCIAATSTTVAVAGYAPFLRGSGAANLEQAGRYLDGTAGDAVEVIVLPEWRVAINPEVGLPLLDLATRKRLVYVRDAALTPALPPAAVATSSLRFTWEYLPGDDYTPKGESATRLIALIASGNGDARPPGLAKRLEGFRLTRRFDRQEDVFGYSPIVEVYEPISGQLRR